MTKTSAYTRRDFLRSTTAAATVAATSAPLLSAAGAVSSVVVVRDQKAMTGGNKVDAAIVEKMVAETVMRVTGEKSTKSAWLSLFKPTDIVGLVPTPHLNPTHDEVVAAVRQQLVEAGIPESNIRNAQGGTEVVKQCTALISLPGLKAHWLTGIGTVLKNYILFSGRARDYHYADSAKLGEIWNLPHVKGKTRLVLVDALRPLCDKGPQPDPRYMWPYKGLIAGKDPVAVERVGLEIITKKRDALRGEPWPLSPPPLCVEAADKDYHLGVSDLKRIKVETVGWSDELFL
ncbi:MAG TPA: DUF362 domain-containing protein [Acidobacteriota bacterium]|nr:DUF362 domain-containing protein [Acidobacteriota bacterium]